MIKIPETRNTEKFYLVQALFLFLFAIFFMASFVVVAYWYIFGANNPFAAKAKDEHAATRLYSNPAFDLKNVIKEKLINEPKSK